VLELAVGGMCNEAWRWSEDDMRSMGSKRGRGVTEVDNFRSTYLDACNPNPGTY